MIFSKMEMCEAGGVLCIPYYDRVLNNCSLYCYGIMRPIFYAVYIATGFRHSTSCHHSPAVTWPSWIDVCQRKIIIACISTTLYDLDDDLQSIKSPFYFYSKIVLFTQKMTSALVIKHTPLSFWFCLSSLITVSNFHRRTEY